jgi:hypothetical protein
MMRLLRLGGLRRYSVEFDSIIDHSLLHSLDLLNETIESFYLDEDIDGLPNSHSWDLDVSQLFIGSCCGTSKTPAPFSLPKAFAYLES